MTFRLASFWFVAGPALALVLAAGGALAVRRRARWLLVVAGLAAAAGWAVLCSTGPGMRFEWGIWLWPRTIFERPVLAALVLAVASYWGGRRWVAFAGVWFAAWWMARAGVAGPEFWRVLFGGVLAAWVLARLGGREPGRAVTSGLVLGGAGLVAGLEVWAGVGLVVAAVAAGVRLAGRGSVMPAGLSMVAIVGVEVGAGRLMQGWVGIMDFACLGALVAPGVVPWVEVRLRRLGRRSAAVCAPVLVSGVLVGFAVVAARVSRGS